MTAHPRDALTALTALALVLAVAIGPAWILAQLPPIPAGDGLRREPDPVVGAEVQTEHGAGVIAAEVAYGDGPRWQIRLETGRHVVLNRAEMVVLR